MMMNEPITLVTEKLPIPSGQDTTGLSWPGERCRSSRCAGLRNVVGFNVDDGIWEKVVGRDTVVCLPCFDIMAQQKGIPYEVRGEVYPVSWSMWLD